MERLRTLTLLYSAVLVLALALSLIAIWVYLERIAGVLADIRAALAMVSRKTEHLGEPLEGLNEMARASAEALEGALVRVIGK